MEAVLRPHAQQLRQFLAECGVEVTPDELGEVLGEIAEIEAIGITRGYLEQGE